MQNNKNCILRLAKYKKALLRLRSLGFIKVFSENLADAIGVDSSQVRKDFSLFNITGSKKGGYIITELIEKLNNVLGKGEPEKVIIIGCGNIGSALMKYKGFQKEDIKIICGFDNNIEKTNKNNKIPIYPLEDLEQFVKTNEIKTAIIATPDLVAQQIADMIISCGIKGILNFAPIHLRVPENIVVTNVNLEIELETVIYYVNELWKE
ncbi:MAG TPA: redox-sensing transcriptional repressor Rex [Spirochaetota bacterium]|nr:redox-sensing transcriptional repressor Rex [Spirochaetota bacterium]